MFAWLRRTKKEETNQPAMGGTSGFVAPFGLHYTRHAQPDPGIAAVSYDAIALPLYTPIGTGIQNLRQFTFAPSGGVVYQRQAIALTTVGNPGYLAGTLRSSPLIDTRSNPGDINIGAIMPAGSFDIPQQWAST